MVIYPRIVCIPSLDCIILIEHQLNAKFRPDESMKSEWVSGTVMALPQRRYRVQRYRGGLALLTRNSMRFSITMHSLSGVVNKILGDNCASRDSRGNAIGSRVSSSLHQAVTWSLLSPFYNNILHLTGVYVFPNRGNLEDFFDTLTMHLNHPLY